MEHHGGSRTGPDGLGPREPRGIAVTTPGQLDDGTDDAPAGEADLANKPVLEWTTEDWQRWTRSRDAEPASATTEVTAVASAPAAEWWSQRPERADAESSQEAFAPAATPVPLPVAPAPAAPTVVELALDPAEAQALVAGTRSAPAHRRHAKGRATPIDRGPTKRARSALGLVATAMLVGAVVASLVTITAFVASLVLERALN